ncbi:MAG: hypothetical protein ACPHY9_09485 [Candidatus Puniceispirillaceae bacterium]
MGNSKIPTHHIFAQQALQGLIRQFEDSAHYQNHGQGTPDAKPVIPDDQSPIINVRERF